MNMRRYFVFLLVLLSASACVKDGAGSNVEEGEAKEYLHEVMNYGYFWYSQIPSGISMEGTVDEYFDRHLVSEDRWSWMTTGEAWRTSESGVYLTYGASMSQPLEYYGSYDVMMRYVWPGSPFALNGVKRGWTLTHINEEEVMNYIIAGTFNDVMSNISNRFTFRDENGESHTFDATAAEVSTRSYIDKRIFTSDDFPGLTSPVGYFNYQTFNSNMVADITSAFSEFKSAGVEDVILDLRYNGGGDTPSLKALANVLAPSGSDGKVLEKLVHSDKLSDNDRETLIERGAGSLDLGRLFVISGRATASASEVIINGLKPIFGTSNLIQVGDTTLGKPCGMYVWPYPSGSSDDTPYDKAEYVFLPICFFTVNMNGEGDYLNGLIPDKYWPDDLFHDWGAEEGIINACLTYIATGSYPNLPDKPESKSEAVPGRKIKVAEDEPGYGRYVVPFKN